MEIKQHYCDNCELETPHDDRVGWRQCLKCGFVYRSITGQYEMPPNDSWQERRDAQQREPEKIAALEKEVSLLRAEMMMVQSILLALPVRSLPTVVSQMIHDLVRLRLEEERIFDHTRGVGDGDA